MALWRSAPARLLRTPGWALLLAVVPSSTACWPVSRSRTTWRCPPTGPASTRAAFARLAEALDLTPFARRSVTETSLGEQQRVALARALILAPRLAVLDEPTGHQDDDHVSQRVREVAHGVVRLEDGRILA